MSIFLQPEDVAILTGYKTKSKQIEALRRMHIPFWVNRMGRPVVPVAAVEGSKKEPPPKKPWMPPD